MDLKRRLRDRRHLHLMSRARAGHEPSFRKLYRALYGPVAGYVARRVEDGADAEDVVAQVFHRFVLGVDRYDASKGSVWTWTMTLARNAVIDHHRKRRPVTDPIEDLADVLRAEADDPLDALVNDEEARLVHGILRDEPVETREMFALHFGDGLRYAEIAEVLGMTEAAVKQRFARTLRKLRTQWSQPKEGGEPHAFGFEDARAADSSARS